MNSCVAVTDMRVTLFSLISAINPFTIRVAQLRITIPVARMFLVGTAGAIDPHCPAKQTLSLALLLPSLKGALEACERSLCVTDHS
jgi:hypothetical protein